MVGDSLAEVLSFITIIFNISFWRDVVSPLRQLFLESPIQPKICLHILILQQEVLLQVVVQYPG